VYVYIEVVLFLISFGSYLFIIIMMSLWFTIDLYKSSSYALLYRLNGSGYNLCLCVYIYYTYKFFGAQEWTLDACNIVYNYIHTPITIMSDKRLGQSNYLLSYRGPCQVCFEFSAISLFRTWTNHHKTF